MSSWERGGCNRRHLILHVRLTVTAHGDRRGLQRLEELDQGRLVGHGQDHEMRMGGLRTTEGQGCGDQGMARLDHVVRRRQVLPHDDVDVLRLRRCSELFNLQHRQSPRIVEKSAI